MSVGLCVVSYNRPEYLERTLKAITKHLTDVVDDLVVVNDGSDDKHNAAYGRAYKVLNRWHNGSTHVITLVQNKGVAYAKNAGLTYLLQSPDNEWLFVGEDDILVQSTYAVVSYIDACKESGLSHLSYALHGPANQGGPVRADDTIAYYPHSVGAWCLYSRKCLEDVGMFNEGFHNAWEHVELTLRLARAGYTTGAYEYADVIHSERFISEIPGSIEKSSIRPRDDWRSSIQNGLRFWAKNMPDTFDDLFGEDKPLHAYAMGILA